MVVTNCIFTSTGHCAILKNKVTTCKRCSCKAYSPDTFVCDLVNELVSSSIFFYKILVTWGEEVLQKRNELHGRGMLGTRYRSVLCFVSCLLMSCYQKEDLKEEAAWLR